MQITKDSHVDHHLTDKQMAFIADKFAGKDAFFIETFDLPKELGTVPCALIGPVTGFAPLTENDTYLAKRDGREHDSRLTKKYSAFETLTVTVIAGPHEGKPCILYTAFGGPQAPKEPGEIMKKLTEATKNYGLEVNTLTNEARLAAEAAITKLQDEHTESVRFWSRHALATAPVPSSTPPAA